MPNRTLRIFLIEDSDDDAFLFRWTLQKSGIPNELLHYADGGPALEQLKAVVAGTVTAPDIVFLDLKLPTFTGFEILDWLQKEGSAKRIHIVVLSGSEHASDVSRANALGAAGYLVKPISVEQLKAHVATAVSGTSASAA